MLRTNILLKKSENEAEEGIKEDVLKLGMPFIAVSVTFLSSGSRFGEVAVILNGEPKFFEILANVQQAPDPTPNG